MSPQAVIKSKLTKERRLADRRATDLQIYPDTPLYCYPGDGIIQTERCTTRKTGPRKRSWAAWHLQVNPDLLENCKIWVEQMN